jgi:CheY-like chemotaxis protein
VVNVLVVDDDPEFRQSVAEMLTREGYSVRQARDGRQAIDTYLGNAAVDVVVTDIFMPEMDGIELIEYFCGDPHVRVIAMGCESPEGIRLDNTARSVGAWAVLDKDNIQRLGNLIGEGVVREA